MSERERLSADLLRQRASELEHSELSRGGGAIVIDACAREIEALRSALDESKRTWVLRAESLHAELRRVTGERDTALSSARTAEAERDTLRAECASISAELGLPPTMRPVEGELRRIMQHAKTAHAARREAGLREAAEVVTAVGARCRDLSENAALAVDTASRFSARASSLEAAADSIRALLPAAPSPPRHDYAAVAFLGEIAGALGIDAQNDGWRVVNFARALRARADDLAHAMRAHGFAVNEGGDEVRAATRAANALAALESALLAAPAAPPPRGESSHIVDGEHGNGCRDLMCIGCVDVDPRGEDREAIEAWRGVAR